MNTLTDFQKELTAELTTSFIGEIPEPYLTFSKKDYNENPDSFYKKLKSFGITNPPDVLPNYTVIRDIFINTTDEGFVTMYNKPTKTSIANRVTFHTGKLCHGNRPIPHDCDAITNIKVSRIINPDLPIYFEANGSKLFEFVDVEEGDMLNFFNDVCFYTAGLFYSEIVIRNADIIYDGIFFQKINDLNASDFQYGFSNGNYIQSVGGIVNKAFSPTIRLEKVENINEPLVKSALFS